MHVGAPELTSAEGRATWSVPVRGSRVTTDRLWFSVPEEHRALLTDLADAAVIGLLVPAMRAGEPLQVEGPVSDELAHAVTHGYQHILEAVIPDTRRIDLEIANPVEATDPAPGVGTGFSGGIDSFTVIAEHFVRPVPTALRLTHLTFFNVGAMTGGEAGRRRFHRMHALLAPAAERIGLPFIPVDSNLDEFFGHDDFVQTHGPRNLSSAALLQGGIGRFYFGSTHPLDRISVQRSHSTAYSDALSMPLLQTRRFRPVFHGSQYTRAEKTAIVAEVEESYRSLHVCTSLTADGRNCSRCSKCLRTELTLELIGRLESYAGAFDLDEYRQVRSAYLDEVASSRDPHLAEVRDVARQAGLSLPSPGAAFVRHQLRRAARKGGELRRRLGRLPRGRTATA